jgi:hypothetical protein
VQYHTPIIPTVRDPGITIPTASQHCYLPGQHSFYDTSFIPQIAPLPTPKRPSTILAIFRRACGRKAHYTIPRHCPLRPVCSPRCVRDPHVAIMTIGIYSCCYIAVVHVFTLLALALPVFGDALASWAETSHHGADLWYSVGGVSSSPHTFIQP